MNITEVRKKVALLRVYTWFERVSGVASAYTSEILAFWGCFFLCFASFDGVRPLGIAFSIAYVKKKRGFTEKVFAFLGVAFGGLFFEDGLCMVLSGIVALLWSFWISFGNKTVGVEKIVAPVCAAVPFAFLGGKEFLVAILSITAFSLAFSGLFRGRKAVSSALGDCGFLCLAFSVSLIFSPVSLGVLSFGLVTAVCFSLEGCERGGHFLGGLTGFFSGLALGGDFMIPLAIGGFLCGMCVKKNKKISILLFFLGFLPFVVDFVAFDFSFDIFVDVAWGIALWVSLSELYLNKKRAVAPQPFFSMTESSEKKLSEAIGGVSLALSGVSKAKRREREEKVRTVVDGIFSAECETCVGCKFPTERLKIKLCRDVMNNKKITEQSFSEPFRTECTRWKFIEEKINGMIEKKPYKTSLRIDTLAEDYMAMAKILSHGERKAENRYYHNFALANKLKMALELKNIRAVRIDVFGVRLPVVQITGVPFRIPFPEKTIKAETERLLGKSVDTVAFESEGKTAKITYKATCPMKVDFYKISIPKKGEIICGDSVATFEADEGCFYSVVSDGMGSGRDAAVCSRLGTVFLEKLISAGIDKALAVSMLGNVISSSEDEIFTTVDLLELDLVRGKMTCIKAGAVPTWVLRNNRAYSVSSKTLPCGIISGSCAEQTVLDCFSGDTIIMASDGGEDAVSKALELVLKEKRTLSPREITSILADIAAKNNKRDDDVSFCVLSVA